MTATIRLDLERNAYPVHVGSGHSLDFVSLFTSVHGLGSRLVVVTDTCVAHLHLENFSRVFKDAGYCVVPVILPPGEQTKSWKYAEILSDRLLEEGVERRDMVVALGGGVIGDLVGFATAILRRGCDFAQVPTTLLSQVDSSVGGKTGIDTRSGKNLIGAFHQPKIVVINTDFLKSLPDRHMRAGYVEAVKTGLIGNRKFFEWCEDNLEAVLARDARALRYLVETSVQFKAQLVMEDETDTLGRRTLLNLGHSFGHALEAELNFSDKILHGEAVAIGICWAFDLSARHKLCSVQDAQSAKAHLARAGLPVHPGELGVSMQAKRLIRHMRQDKKMEGNRLTLILAKGIGQAFPTQDIPLEDVALFLESVL